MNEYSLRDGRKNVWAPLKLKVIKHIFWKVGKGISAYVSYQIYIFICMLLSETKESENGFITQTQVEN